MNVKYHLNDNDELCVILLKKDYDRLLKDSQWLGCLEEAGVDNWSGIDFAHEINEQYKKEED